ncbi:IS200/IS605 family transposase [Wolbachia endosymbiont of Frankliniella intonsa]|uniref:IS200/IS605 family transposase n=1 Tax=Wolbachia endosymbiont of Frankliniella intonsa TaxID=2902422 RepID=UPI00244E6945|nr:IS200/IS605 family transposase [Wolbachia endosymbiont of Frankliniella intonsa]WGJ61792.1 IS200/IS605 family transposase [Wolbachia endosymbiont of Frankliniella intonsa]WGJ62428.1 IS200/IS605 family transposase [Wolbachia endosymbiont of Frankliniella intonsa]
MKYYRKSSHSVYDCTYHIVWITKYRYPVLVGDIGLKAREIIQAVCRDNQVEIIRGKVASSHVHIYVSVPPYLSISKLVQLIKGRCSRKIQQSFPELRKKYWGNHLWAVGYFVRTTGNVTDQMIKDYIENHSKREDKFGDFQVEN